MIKRKKPHPTKLINIRAWFKTKKETSKDITTLFDALLLAMSLPQFHKQRENKCFQLHICSHTLC